MSPPACAPAIEPGRKAERKTEMEMRKSVAFFII
jgi:hypothetical protein